MFGELGLDGEVIYLNADGLDSKGERILELAETHKEVWEDEQLVCYYDLGAMRYINQVVLVVVKFARSPYSDDQDL
ncbi:MAG: hypothetical protein ACM3KM_02980 [Acidobacteriaceae bacterium]